MGILDNLERGLERAVRSLFSAGGSRKVKPVEIANTIRLRMDREAYSISAGRTFAPNVFTVSFNPENFDQVQEWGTSLAEELCDEAIRHASEQGYTLQGPVKVTFLENDNVARGDIKVRAATEVSNQQPPAQHPAPTPAPQTSHPGPTHHQPAPASSSPLVPVLEVNGARYAVNSSSAVLGRATDADITIQDPGMSRRHMEIQVEPASNRVRAVDLGSTNGFFLNGRKVQGSTELRHGDIITAGRTRIIFRMTPSSSTGGRP